MTMVWVFPALRVLLLSCFSMEKARGFCDFDLKLDMILLSAMNFTKVYTVKIFISFNLHMN